MLLLAAASRRLRSRRACASQARSAGAPRVVDLDVVMDAARELDPSLPARRLSSSTWSRPQKLAIIALSAAVPTAPIDGAIPAVRRRSLNAQEVYCLGSTGPRNTLCH
jgi:hypothetical protein